jgi:hypothetical protein
VNNSDIDLSSFVFRSLLKGLWWSATGILIAIWIIIIAFFLTGLNEFAGYDLSNTESVLQGVGSFLGGIASFIYITIAFSVIGFFMIGAPIAILPSIIGSAILSIWLYRDRQTNKLSGKRTQIRGALLGGLTGIVALFIPYRPFEWPSIWLWFATQNEYLLLFWVILIIISLCGVITGRLFAKSLAKELEPKEEYFSIDWEALQKEQ